jgi:hypothetical protein
MDYKLTLVIKQRPIPTNGCKCNRAASLSDRRFDRLNLVNADSRVIHDCEIGQGIQTETVHHNWIKSRIHFMWGVSLCEESNELESSYNQEEGFAPCFTR